jgi:hypothetical protein
MENLAAGNGAGDVAILQNIINGMFAVDFRTFVHVASS